MVPDGGDSSYVAKVSTLYARHETLTCKCQPYRSWNLRFCWQKVLVQRHVSTERLSRLSREAVELFFQHHLSWSGNDLNPEKWADSRIPPSSIGPVIFPRHLQLYGRESQTTIFFLSHTHNGLVPSTSHDQACACVCARLTLILT